MILLPKFGLEKPRSVTAINRGLAERHGTIWLSVANSGLLLHDLISGRNISSPGSVVPSQEGPAIAYNGSQQTNLAFTLPGGTTADNYVIAARIRATATQTASPGAAFGLYSAAGVQTGIGVGFDTANAVGSAYLHGNGAGLAARSAGSLNTWYTVFVAANLLGGANYAHRAWINGAAATTDQGGAQVGGVSALDEIAVGAQHRSAGFLRQFTGQIAWASILYLPNGNGSFTDDSARQLFRSGYPYNLFSRRIWVPVSAGGNVTQALTGVSTTTVTGTLAPSLTVALSGSTATASAGTITPTQVATQALTGTAATTATGTVAATLTVALTGEAATTAAGTVAAGGDVSVNISGQSATTNTGTVTVSVSGTQAISGQSSTVSPGTITPTQAATVALTGQQILANTGTVTPQITVSLTGVSSTGNTGTVTPETGAVVALSGAAATISPGTVGVAASATVALSGEFATVSTGTIVPASADISLALSGLGVIAYAGTIQLPGVWVPVIDASSNVWNPVVDTNGNTWTNT